MISEFYLLEKTFILGPSLPLIFLKQSKQHTLIEIWWLGDKNLFF